MSKWYKTIKLFKMNIDNSNQYASDEVRQTCYNLCLDKLEKYNVGDGSIDDEEMLEDMAFKIEEAAYNKCPITKYYKPQIRIILANMSHTKNAPLVRQRLYAKEWTPETYGAMTSDEMYPERVQEELDEELEKARIIKYFKDKKLENDSMYTCGKCKSKKIEHVQVQTRSADEPMTVKACCLMCGNRWRM